MLQGRRSSHARTSLTLFLSALLVFALMWLGELLLAGTLPASTLEVAARVTRILMVAFWALGVLSGLRSLKGEGYRMQALLGIVLNAAGLAFAFVRAGSFF